MGSAPGIGTPRLLPPTVAVGLVGVMTLMQVSAGHGDRTGTTCPRGGRWFALTGRGINIIAYAIGGYLVLMALIQIRLLPAYLKLRFSPGFWAFTFSYAIAITCALEWITSTNPPGATAYAIAAITAISVFIGVIAARTVIAVARGQFLAQPAEVLPGLRTAMRG